MAENVRSERIVISYPPTFDGELHIDVKETGRNGKFFSYEYSFRRATADGRGNAWNNLVEIAKDIMDQDARLRAQPRAAQS